MGLGELFRAMGEDDVGVAVPLVGKELDKFKKSYVHLDLKAGDKVRWKKGYADKRLPKEGEVVEVFSVFTSPHYTREGGSNHFMDQLDFSVAFKEEGGTPYLFAFDSRRFEKV